MKNVNTSQNYKKEKMLDEVNNFKQSNLDLAMRIFKYSW